MSKKLLSKILIFGVLALIVIGAAGFGLYKYVKATLPQMITIEDYKPLLVSQVYDRKGQRIGEFSNQRRILTPSKDIPDLVSKAFVAAEDDQFYQHSGINYMAIMRAALANLKAGRNVQGGSTITQQVSKTLLLTSEKTFIRKAKEALLAQQMEENLSKDDILYLYLNQIYFGQGAYGIAMAADTYYRKPVKDLTVAEAAMLAGLPKAPSAYSPIRNPSRAKERQLYVLRRMEEVGFITAEQRKKSSEEPLTIYMRENYDSYAPFYLETIRQLLVAEIGEETLLNGGVKIYTSLDLQKQQLAQESVTAGLKDLDKRQGFRGPLKNITEPREVGEFLYRIRNELIAAKSPERVLLPEGKFIDYGPLNLNYDIKKGLPDYLKIGTVAEAIVNKVDDAAGLVYIKLAEVNGIIDFETMQWARKPDPEKRSDLDLIKKPSQALKIGDVVLVKVTGPKFTVGTRLQKYLNDQKKQKIAVADVDYSKYLSLELDQEPIVEGALLSLDTKTQDIIAMVGGYDFKRSEYNKALQAARQTGSSFKSIVYASALDKGYTPATPIMDAPVVFDEVQVDDEGQESQKTWRPANHSKSFGGDILFRNALVKSLNVPSVKILEDITVPWAIDYSRRLGIYSPLNADFTLTLGSSSVTLYEMTKAFTVFARLGKRVSPLIVTRVEDARGQKILENLTLDKKFQKELETIEKPFEERRKAYLEKLTAAQKAGTAEEQKSKSPDANFFFQDPDQLIKPTTAYLMTSLLKAVVEDKNGTGGRARAVEREVAGKTGTTNGYFDAWFIGYSAQLSTGVWVGFEKEKTLGKGEVGGRSALPIWTQYMKGAHEDLPQMTFPVPEGIVFANIDSKTGRLASAQSNEVIRQAFLEGTEPTFQKESKEEETDFLKQDLIE